MGDTLPGSPDMAEADRTGVKENIPVMKEIIISICRALLIDIRMKFCKVILIPSLDETEYMSYQKPAESK